MNVNRVLLRRCRNLGSNRPSVNHIMTNSMLSYALIFSSNNQGQGVNLSWIQNRLDVIIWTDFDTINQMFFEVNTFNWNYLRNIFSYLKEWPFYKCLQSTGYVGIRINMMKLRWYGHFADEFSNSFPWMKTLQYDPTLVVYSVILCYKLLDIRHG